MSTSHPYQALKKRTTDVLAYFDSPVPSKIRLELLCGSAPGFRNLANYITPPPARTRRIQTPPTL